MAFVLESFQTAKSDPQEVTNAIVNLINLPKDQKPLRTLVDTSTVYVTIMANNTVKVQYDKPL